tara:strand:+ start:5745 stop:6299 length:555 start_codon:yes stop_codon:yes gene_type:complete
MRFEEAAPRALITSIDNVIYSDNKLFGQVGTINPDGSTEYNRKVRSVDSFSLSEQGIGTSVALRVIYNDLTRLTNSLLKSYNNKVPYSPSPKKFEYSFLHYTDEQKGHYDWHTDHNTDYAPRTYTIILGLNDDYRGGELKIINDNVNIKLKKNQAVMFPSNFLFPHKVEPVLLKTRKVLVIWIT